MSQRVLTDDLRGHLENATGTTVEVGERTVDPPSYVLHPVSGGGYWAGLQVDHAQGTFAFQVTCAAVNREQAQWLLDEAVEHLPTTTAAQVVKCVTVGGVRIHRDVDPPVWVATPLFHVTT